MEGIREFGSLPELMRAILESPVPGMERPINEYQATSLVVAWLRAHPEVVRELLPYPTE